MEEHLRTKAIGKQPLIHNKFVIKERRFCEFKRSFGNLLR